MDHRRYIRRAVPDVQGLTDLYT